MRDVLVRAMRTRGGVITRREALCLVPHHVLDRAISGGGVRRIHPSVFVLVERATDEAALDRAALAYVPGGALSHVTALRVLGIPNDPVDDRRHVVVGERSRRRGGRELVIHRRRGFVAEPPQTMTRAGLRVVQVDRSVIDSWPWLVPSERRKPAINAVASGLTTPDRLNAALAAAPAVPGAAEMRELFDLLRLGCRSELELWGHRDVFDHPALPLATLQHVVRTKAGSFVLDRAYLAEKVAVELDGAAWHCSRTQRERDVRRDAALAAVGWLVVRFTHARLHTDPAGCRAELAAVLGVRCAA